VLFPQVTQVIDARSTQPASHTFEQQVGSMAQTALQQSASEQ
jgi:hypothetical protein